MMTHEANITMVSLYLVKASVIEPRDTHGTPSGDAADASFTRSNPACSLAAALASLTDQQRRLLQLIEHRNRYHLPAVQRDLAESLGIRRDSLNKLLHRMRATLRRHGFALRLPQRCRNSAVAGFTLSEWV